MDLTKLSPIGLLMLHNSIRDALSVDDNTRTGPKLYGVRDTPDWRQWSDALEKELQRRGALFKPIEWD